MAKEIRSVLRKIDQAILKGEMKKAFSAILSAVNEFDREKSYGDSIEILVKSISYDEISKTGVVHQELIAHLMIRYVLNGDIKQAKDLKFDSDLNVPLSDLALMILDSHVKDSGGTYILQSVEKKSIFGDFTSIRNVPALMLDSEDDIVRVLEDFYSNGKYVANLLEKETLLQHSVKVDVGSSEETNIVEHRRVYRIN